MAELMVLLLGKVGKLYSFLFLLSALPVRLTTQLDSSLTNWLHILKIFFSIISHTSFIITVVANHFNIYLNAASTFSKLLKTFTTTIDYGSQKVLSFALL